MQALRSKNGTTADLVDEMFETFLDWRAPARFTYAATPLDLYEKDGKFVLEIAVPGFEAKDVNVEVSGQTVTVSGEHAEKTEKGDVRYHRREMRRGAFSRSVTLPTDLDANAVVATIEKGVLKVELSPVKPIAPKKIAVKQA